MSRQHQAFRLGNTVVEPSLNQITRDNNKITVERQVMRVLLLLTRHVGEVVSREEILEQVWTNSAPNDEGLTQAISKLRKALDDTPRQGKHIQTIRKVGYRLRGPIYSVSQSKPARLTSPIASAPRKAPSKAPQIMRRWFVAAVVTATISTSVLVLLLAGAFADSNPASSTSAVSTPPVEQKTMMKIRMAVPEEQAADFLAGIANMPKPSLDSIAFRALSLGGAAYEHGAPCVYVSGERADVLLNALHRAADAEDGLRLCPPDLPVVD